MIIRCSFDQSRHRNHSEYAFTLTFPKTGLGRISPEVHERPGYWGSRRAEMP